MWRVTFLGALFAIVFFCGDVRAAEQSASGRAAEPISTTVRSFLTNARGWGETNRVRLRGVVTLSTSDGTFFVQDGEAGVYVFHRPAKKLAPGELVEVTGNPSLGGVLPALQNCAVTEFGKSAEPMVVPLTSAEAANPTNLMKLARMEGVLQKHRLGGGRSLVLQPENSDPVFEADAETLTNLDPLEQIPAGSLLRATGVVIAKTGPEKKIVGVRLLIRSAADIVVLKGPPF